MQDNITFVLCNTTHSGNIGSSARAIKTMGFKNLSLVSPEAKCDSYAYALASNATDILDNIKIYNNLKEAIENCNLAYALSARKREFDSHIQTPREMTKEIFSANNYNIAIVFGAEKTGLRIDQLELCNRLVTIPANPLYTSLNLAQAVQIIAYELFVNKINNNIRKQQATIIENLNLINELDKLLSKSNYYKQNKSNITRRRIQNILFKTNLNSKEVDLILGILKLLNKNG